MARGRRQDGAIRPRVGQSPLRLGVPRVARRRPRRRVSDRRRALAFVTRASKRTLYRSWSTWRFNAHECKAKRARARRALAVATRDALASAFFAWSRRTSDEKFWRLQVVVAERFLLAAAKRSVFRAFASWRERTLDVRVKETKVLRAVHRLSRKTARAFVLRLAGRDDDGGGGASSRGGGDASVGGEDDALRTPRPRRVAPHAPRGVLAVDGGARGDGETQPQTPRRRRQIHQARRVQRVRRVVRIAPHRHAGTPIGASRLLGGAIQLARSRRRVLHVVAVRGGGARSKPKPGQAIHPRVDQSRVLVRVHPLARRRPRAQTRTSDPVQLVGARARARATSAFHAWLERARDASRGRARSRAERRIACATATSPPPFTRGAGRWRRRASGRCASASRKSSSPRFSTRRRTARLAFGARRLPRTRRTNARFFSRVIARAESPGRARSTRGSRRRRRLVVVASPSRGANDSSARRRVASRTRRSTAGTNTRRSVPRRGAGSPSRSRVSLTARRAARSTDGRIASRSRTTARVAREGFGSTERRGDAIGVVVVEERDPRRPSSARRRASFRGGRDEPSRRGGGSVRTVTARRRSAIPRDVPSVDAFRRGASRASRRRVERFARLRQGGHVLGVPPLARTRGEAPPREGGARANPRAMGTARVARRRFSRGRRSRRRDADDAPSRRVDSTPRGRRFARRCSTRGRGETRARIVRRAWLESSTRRRARRRLEARDFSPRFNGGASRSPSSSATPRERRNARDSPSRNTRRSRARRDSRDARTFDSRARRSRRGRTSASDATPRASPRRDASRARFGVDSRARWTRGRLSRRRTLGDEIFARAPVARFSNRRLVAAFEAWFFVVRDARAFDASRRRHTRVVDAMLHRRIRAAFRGVGGRVGAASARYAPSRLARRRASRVVASPKDSTRGTRTRANAARGAPRFDDATSPSSARFDGSRARRSRARGPRGATPSSTRARFASRFVARKKSRARRPRTRWARRCAGGAAPRTRRDVRCTSRDARSTRFARRRPFARRFSRWLRETKTTKDSRALGARRASHVQRMWRRVLNRACHLAFRGWTRRVEERRRLRVAAKRVASRARARRGGAGDGWMGRTSSASVKNRARRGARGGAIPSTRRRRRVRHVARRRSRRARVSRRDSSRGSIPPRRVTTPNAPRVRRVGRDDAYPRGVSRVGAKGDQEGHASPRVSRVRGVDIVRREDARRRRRVVLIVASVAILGVATRWSKARLLRSRRPRGVRSRAATPTMARRDATMARRRRSFAIGATRDGEVVSRGDVTRVSSVDRTRASVASRASRDGEDDAKATFRASPRVARMDETRRRRERARTRRTRGGCSRRRCSRVARRRVA